MIDTHAHLYLEEFDQDRPEVLSKAEKEGVRRIYMPAIDSATHSALFQAENQFPGTCLAMMGLHPCSVGENFREELKIALDWLEKRPFSAIGESGLDFFWDLSFVDQQYLALHEQMEWALHFGLPIVLHSRDSIDECIKMVAEHQDGQLKGVFHCFTGSLDQARQIIDLGFFLGIGGVLTFKNSGLDKVMKQLDLEKIVLETDSPYLAPVPFRGKRNESAYLKYVVEKLAELKGLSKEEIEKKTTENAMRLFSPTPGRLQV